MTYRFALEDQDFSDYASGRVIYNLPGAPAFPLRLASEVFQRAEALLGKNRPLALFDPCCGAAYHLCALGFLHGNRIRSILAADIDGQAVVTAERNLGLLGPDGLNRREAELREMLAQFGKSSHAEALESVKALRKRLPEGGIPGMVFRADALSAESLQAGTGGAEIDLVFSDVPYGQLSGWQAAPGAEPPLYRLLESLRAVIRPGTVVAIAADKSQKAAHLAYQRAEHFKIGKRQVTLLCYNTHST